MSHTANTSMPPVPPEEVERSIAEYRRLGYEHRAPAHVVYHPPHQPCPWPGCDRRIAGIGFQLDRMGDSAVYERLLEAWWQGPGLIGCCPGCGQPVLFGMLGKQVVADPAALDAPVLPADWHTRAYLVPNPDK